MASLSADRPSEVVLAARVARQYYLEGVSKVDIADRLGVALTDPVTIVNPDGTMTPFGQTAAMRSYPVNVIFDIGMPEVDSFYIYMPMQVAQVYFKQFTDQLKPGAQMPGVMASDAEIDAFDDFSGAIALANVAQR